MFEGSLAAVGALGAIALNRQLNPKVDAATAPVLIVGAGKVGGVGSELQTDRSWTFTLLLKALIDKTFSPSLDKSINQPF